MSPSVGFAQFLHHGRLEMTFEDREIVRAVYYVEVVRRTEDAVLEEYMADRLPYFYKEPAAIAESFEQGFFLTAIRNVLLRLPTAESFQQSHFAEIISGVYGEEILGLGRLYSKLALLTSENANAYKMDILFYRRGSEPAEFVLAEVKSSMKTADDGLPAGHDTTCFASLFASFNQYKTQDLAFDLAAIEERLPYIPEPDRENIKQALLPHRKRHIKYAGFCVIDRTTHCPAEAKVLATRKNDKKFDVDLLCIAELPEVVTATYALLQGGRR